MHRGGASLLFALFTVVSAMPPREAWVPQLKKGFNVVDNVRREGSSLQGLGPNRLLVHAVSDSTGTAYAKAVTAALRDVKMHQLPFRTEEQVDAALSSLLEHWCFVEDRGLNDGRALFHGWNHFFPRFKHRLPLSHRALCAWERLAPSREGKPVPWEVITVVVRELVKEGRYEEGVAIWFLYDVYAREQDLDGLRGEDIAGRGDSCAVRFGVAARGERSKTGPDQGAVVDDPVLSRILIEAKRRLSPHEKVFPFSPAYLRGHWARVLEKIGFGRVPLHSLRHSKPSREALRKTRSLEDIRRRGRWNQMKSMQRYSKVHTLTAVEAETPAGLMRDGGVLEKEFHDVLRQVVQAATSSTRKGRTPSALGDATQKILRELPPVRCGTQPPEALSASAPSSPRR